MSGLRSDLEAAAPYFVNVLRIAANVADAETVTIDGTVYEFDRAANGVTAGRTAVTGHSDDTPANASTALAAQINASQGGRGIHAVRVSANEILIYSKRAIACAETLGGTNNAFAAATSYGGKDQAVNLVSMVQRTPTAVEIALDSLKAVFPFTVTSVLVRVTTSGVNKAWDGAATFSGNTVTVTNAGSTDWDASDRVTILACGNL